MKIIKDIDVDEIRTLVNSFDVIVNDITTVINSSRIIILSKMTNRNEVGF